MTDVQWFEATYLLVIQVPLDTALEVLHDQLARHRLEVGGMEDLVDDLRVLGPLLGSHFLL